MGQPNPPGDNVPLYEGLGADWNDIVGAFPEEKRAELAPLLKERISGYQSQLEAYKPWDDFQKSGITPEHVNTALQIQSVIENNPQQVYEAIGNSLGISAKQAEKVVDKLENTNPTQDNPELATLRQQVETMAQLMIAQRDGSVRENAVAQEEAALEAAFQGLKKKYGDVDEVAEEQILMRMNQKDMSIEEAYNDYSNFVSSIRKTRPAPMVMGSGGSIPSRAIDPTKLDSKGTKSLVAQMLDHANATRTGP
jgi:hypothetical protein